MVPPPSDPGADQTRSICVDPLALAARSVGVPGMVASLSPRFTVAVAWLPALTPVVSVPNPSCTLLPWSLSESSVAVTVIVLDVSAAPNVSITGTPE